MTRTVLPGMRRGSVKIPASKSQAHRYLICAALSERPSDIYCDGMSKDILATADCLNALGAGISVTGSIIHVEPVRCRDKSGCTLRCGESGSTLRFLLPVAGALGAEGCFVMEGRLPERPLHPYDSELMSHGMNICRDGDRLRFSGRLRAGEYTLPGNVSSQYVSGLLMALPLLSGDSALHIEGPLESAGYVSMTLEALQRAGVRMDGSAGCYLIPGGQTFRMPAALTVEGDYSNAAFFLCAGALSDRGVTVTGLRGNSVQGDRRIAEILAGFGAEVSAGETEITVRCGKLRGQTVDASMIPDLVPALSVVAAAAEGVTRFVNAGRLRLKESDRLESTAGMLTGLGADVSVTDDGLVINGRPALDGGTVDSCGDHRIAMAAAVAACVCRGPVSVLAPQCVQKSYPRFWDDFSSLEVVR